MTVLTRDILRSWRALAPVLLALLSLAGAAQAERFEALVQKANRQVLAGDKVGALWTLRRAANHAPNRDAADDTRAVFQALRADVPFRLALDFAVRPSDNINGGVEDRTFQLGGLTLLFPDEALALSGVEFVGAADLSHRVARTAHTRTDLFLSLYGRTYSLSQEAQDMAPEASGSDYALTQVAGGLAQTFGQDPTRRPLTLAVQAGRVHHGGDPLRRFARLGFGQGLSAPQGMSLDIGGYVEWQDPLRADQPNARWVGLYGTTAWRLPNRDVLSVAADLQRYDADIATYAYDAGTLALRWARADPVLGTSLTFETRLGARHYDSFSLSLDGRDDRSIAVSAKAVFNHLSSFGFSPAVTLTAEQTESTVARYDTRALRLGIGMQSNF